MDTPQSYPCFVYYFDGFSQVVNGPEEVQPGWRNNPCAPFPEMAQGWQWAISHADGWTGAPYAPDRSPWRYEPGMPHSYLVYSTFPQVVDGVQRSAMEVWRGGSAAVEERRRTARLFDVPPSAQLARSARNSRCFLDLAARDAYDRRYDSRDLTGFERDAVLSQGRGRGRPADAEWRQWTLERLIGILKSGWQKARQTHPDKKRPSFPDVAAATGYPERDLRRAIQKYRYDWQRIRTLLNE